MLGLRTLVLNANYMPISLFPLHSIPVEDAVTRILNDTCHSVFNYDREILTPSLKMKWPAIVARNNQQKIREKVKLRRESLFYRDHGVCVYCEKPLTLGEATFDHVIPRSAGGKHEWSNVVCSCGPCNHSKGSAPAKGLWEPKFEPYEPSYWELLDKRRYFPILIYHESWLDFIGDWKAPVSVVKG